MSIFLPKPETHYQKPTYTDTNRHKNQHNLPPHQVWWKKVEYFLNLSFTNKIERKSSLDFYRVLTAQCLIEVKCCRITAGSEIYQAPFCVWSGLVNEKKRLTLIKRKKSSRKWGTRNKRRVWSSIATPWTGMDHPPESHICPLAPKSHDELTSEIHACTSAPPLASEPRTRDWCFWKEFIFPAVRCGETFNWRVYRGANECFSNS